MEYRFAERMSVMKPSSIRELLKMTERPEVISFAGGLPASELFPVEDIRIAAERTLQEFGSKALQYGVSEGIASLRDQIAEEMSSRGVECGREDILITTGSQQAIDLVGKVFLNSGDCIFTENPTYLAAIQSFQCFQANFVPIPTDDDGIIPEELDEAASHRHAKFVYLIPNFQNPTGKTMPIERRQKLYEIAVKKNLILIEDDPYGRLRYRGAHIPPIKSFDRTGHVLYLSTFSKTVSPGFRTGWIVAPKEIRDKLIITKQAADLHTSSLDQLILERYLRDFDNRAHVEKVRAAYGERYIAMNAALKKHMSAEWSWTHPEGGMFLWVKGPEGTDTKKLFLRAIEKNVAFVPGEDFFPDGGGQNFMRLNFSNSNTAMIHEGISRLAQICASATREEI